MAEGEGASAIEHAPADDAADVAPAQKGNTSRRIDPLLLLREATQSQQKVRYCVAEECLEFEARRVHRNAKCGFRLGLLNGKKGPLIDIGSVWFMHKQISDPSKTYTPETAKKYGFTYMSVAVRSDLCDYLVGRVQTCPGLVHDVLEGKKMPKGEKEWENQPRKRRRTAKGLDGLDEEEDELAHLSSEITYADVAERVRPVKDLDVLVRCPGKTVPNADLILRIAQAELSGQRPTHVQSFSNGKVPLWAELEEYLSKDKAANPIIMVPCNKNAPVNLLNAHEFLQNGNYHRPDREHLRFFESTRPESVEVSRNINGKVWTFEVRDNATRFTKAQWKRCIGVIIDGSDWQFKGWPFESTVDIFTTMCGVFIETKTIKAPVHVHTWQVKILKMNAMHLEHRFGHVRDHTFDGIEKFMGSFRNQKYANNTLYDHDKRDKEIPPPIL